MCAGRVTAPLSRREPRPAPRCSGCPAKAPRLCGLHRVVLLCTQCPARTACDRPEHFNHMPSVPCSTSSPVDRTRGPLSNAWSPQRLLSTATHTACLLGSGWCRGTSSSSVPKDAVPRAVIHLLFQVRKRFFFDTFLRIFMCHRVNSRGGVCNSALASTLTEETFSLLQWDPYQGNGLTLTTAPSPGRWTRPLSRRICPFWRLHRNRIIGQVTFSG